MLIGGEGGKTQRRISLAHRHNQSRAMFERREHEYEQINCLRVRQEHNASALAKIRHKPRDKRQRSVSCLGSCFVTFQHVTSESESGVRSQFCRGSVAVASIDNQHTHPCRSV